MHIRERDVYKSVKETKGEGQRSCIEAEWFIQSQEMSHPRVLTRVTNSEAGRTAQVPPASTRVFKSDVSCKLEGRLSYFSSDTFRCLGALGLCL